MAEDDRRQQLAEQRAREAAEEEARLAAEEALEALKVANELEEEAKKLAGKGANVFFRKMAAFFLPFFCDFPMTFISHLWFVLVHDQLRRPEQQPWQRQPELVPWLSPLLSLSCQRSSRQLVGMRPA